MGRKESEKNHSAQGALTKEGERSGSWIITGSALIDGKQSPAILFYNYQNGKTHGGQREKIISGPYEGAVREFSAVEGFPDGEVVISAYGRILAKEFWINNVCRRFQLFDYETGNQIKEINYNESRQRHGRCWEVKNTSRDDLKALLQEGKITVISVEDWSYGSLDHREKVTIIDNQVVAQEISHYSKIKGLGTRFKFRRRLGEDYLVDFELFDYSGSIRPQQGTRGFLGPLRAINDPENSLNLTAPDYTYDLPSLPFAIRLSYNYLNSSLDLELLPHKTPRQVFPESTNNISFDEFKPVYASNLSGKLNVWSIDGGLLLPIPTPLSYSNS
jgi:hypothetical protein